MKYVSDEPSHHPTAWLSLVAGLMMLGYLLLTRDMTGTEMVGFLAGVSFTALGLAELLRLLAVTVVLRIVGLLFAVATIVVSLYALIFQIP